ncbi:S41 family peptidase [Pedobacter duraquae]|uniref:Peptidase S41-like protein n=1 Tax=Pedobacter duraquae TaxID=425511 RepID=A0A4R6ICL7_9SPHI|nr:S41 family peptidase [Pedobacter duraquae]TDO19712.1 peptidase S41-like protein [Pedobacter duraquae]
MKLTHLKKTVSGLALLILSCSSQFALAQDCHCQDNVKFVINKIEANYSGFTDKVTSSNKAAYEMLKDSLLKRSVDEKDFASASCVNLIQKYIAFFKDGHMYTSQYMQPPAIHPDTIRNQFKSWPKINYSKAGFIKYLQATKKRKPLEGIWTIADQSYSVGLIYEKGMYNAFIINADSLYWMPGQVKFKIPERPNTKAVYYLRNHTSDTVAVSFKTPEQNVIETGTYGFWYKTDLKTGKAVSAWKPVNTAPNNQVVSFTRLNDKTNVLTIKNFDSRYLRAIDSVVKANAGLLGKTDNLIIDVRGNGGGADISYRSLKKYLYTDPYRIIGVDYWCSPDNVEKFNLLTKDMDFPEESRKNFKRYADSMTVHLNGYWSPFAEIIEEKMDTVLTYPKRVAVLMDENCGSTTEQFLMDPVSNSRKVTKMGQHSAGILDYASLHGIHMPCGYLDINYATAKSRRIKMGKGIDNKGIQPDIILDKNIDWIDYAQKYLEK